MWNGPYGMMGGWDGWGWFWPFHFIIPLLFLALIIMAVALAVRYAAGWGDHPPRLERRSPGLYVLEERYARGEINRDEYLEKKRDISG
jgi:putative membrane protein